MCFANKPIYLSIYLSISDVAIARRYDLELRQPAATGHDYCDISNAIELSEYKEAAISYIAGYVVKMVEKNPLSTMYSGVDHWTNTCLIRLQ